MSREILRRALERVDRGERVAVATVAATRGSVPGKRGVKLLLQEDGSFYGTVGGAGLEEKVKQACRDALQTGKGGLQTFDLLVYREGGLDSLCGGSLDIVIEVFMPKPHILICGGGHVGLEVARLADQLEYDHSVLDDRPEYASEERFPTAQGRFVAGPVDFFATEDLNRFTHMVLLGYSHHIDTDILSNAVRRFDGWVGAIASRTKKKLMFQKLKAEGLREEQLSRVESPIGLEIGAESPAEIAVAILGSIIREEKVRAGIPLGKAEEASPKS